MSDPTSSDRRVYGERYEIERKIARGGMADVFLARDQLLDRPVALKVLFSELSVDPTFVERFRREAQNAAKLSHPNIVSVYDSGEDRGSYYIVMEYVEGEPLSAMLRKRGALDPRQAATVGAEVASALAFAHRNGVIHRDVKPGNVLIDPRGGVKVTDFGIARARNTTENLTQTGAVMGTATYFSPEQAQGHSVDQRSDVYSLGVLIYEMVGGKPPFAGDNPVTIAYKHVRETPPPLSAPADLVAIIGQSLAKDPHARYQSADEMRADLTRYMHGQPVQASGSQAADSTQAVPTGYAAAAGAYADSTRTIPSVPPGTPKPTPDLPRDKKRGVAGPLIGLLVLLVLIGVGLGLLFKSSFLGGSSTPVQVPNVVGKSQSDAESTLTQAKLRSTVTNKPDPSAPAGQVTAQDPAQATTVNSGSLVNLTVSSGPGATTVPNVSGQSLSDAKKAIINAGLKVGSTSSQPSDDVDKDKVVSTSPGAGSSANKGDAVSIVVSSGTAPVSIPDLQGASQSDAQSQLQNLGFRTVIAYDNSQQPQNNVISTDPPGGKSAPKGSLVTIHVSNGTSTSSSSSTSSTSTSSPSNTGGNSGQR